MYWNISVHSWSYRKDLSSSIYDSILLQLLPFPNPLNLSRYLGCCLAILFHRLCHRDNTKNSHASLYIPLFIHLALSRPMLDVSAEMYFCWFRFDSVTPWRLVVCSKRVLSVIHHSIAVISNFPAMVDHDSVRTNRLPVLAMTASRIIIYCTSRDDSCILPQWQHTANGNEDSREIRCCDFREKEGDENAEERGLDLLNNSQLLETIVDFIQHWYTICSNSWV